MFTCPSPGGSILTWSVLSEVRLKLDTFLACVDCYTFLDPALLNVSADCLFDLFIAHSFGYWRSIGRTYPLQRGLIPWTYLTHSTIGRSGILRLSSQSASQFSTAVRSFSLFISIRPSDSISGAALSGFFGGFLAYAISYSTYCFKLTVKMWN